MTFTGMPIGKENLGPLHSCPTRNGAELRARRGPRGEALDSSHVTTADKGGRHVDRSAERANLARSETGRRIAGTIKGSPWPASPRRPNLREIVR